MPLAALRMVDDVAMVGGICVAGIPHSTDASLRIFVVTENRLPVGPNNFRHYFAKG